MDPDSDNYNFLAEKDDGSCYYSGGVVFYHDKETSQNLINAGITHLKYYVDGNFQKSIYANIYWDNTPDCHSQTAFTIENYGLGQVKSRLFNYQIKDQNNIILKSGTFTIKAKSCEAVEFVY